MIFKLETPEHQRTAIQSVVEVFRGMEKNTYDNATDEDIRANYCSLSLEALMANINRIAAENGVDPLQSYLQESRNACIEMILLSMLSKNCGQKSFVITRTATV